MSDLKVGDVIATYLTLRNRKEAIVAAMRQQTAEIDAKMTKIEAWIKQHALQPLLVAQSLVHLGFEVGRLDVDDVRHVLLADALDAPVGLSVDFVAVDRPVPDDGRR